MATYAADSNNDVVFPLRRVSGLEEMGQRIRRRLETWRGSWFLDTSAGIPYEEGLGENNLSLRQLADEMTRYALLTPGVARVSDVSFDVDERTGEATYAATFYATATVKGSENNAALLVTTALSPSGMVRAYIRTGGIV